MKNYDLVIDLMADKIKEQGETIALMKWQIDNLKKKLAAAECHTVKPSEQGIEIR